MNYEGQVPHSLKRLPQWERAFFQTLNHSEPKSSGWEFRCYSEVDSTMDVARKLLPSLSTKQHGFIVAEKQTNGRGRQGRKWRSTESGLYITFAFLSSASIDTFSGLSLAVGVALRETFKSLGAEVFLKWPNDVLTSDHRKLSGVLVELINHGDLNAVLIGIGVNLTETPPEENAAALHELTIEKYNPVDMAVFLAPEIKRMWRVFQEQGFAPFKEEWMKSAIDLNKNVAIQTGENCVSGKFIGVNDVGSLLLKQGDKVTEVSSGHFV